MSDDEYFRAIEELQWTVLQYHRSISEQPPPPYEEVDPNAETIAIRVPTPTPRIPGNPWEGPTEYLWSQLRTVIRRSEEGHGGEHEVLKYMAEVHQLADPNIREGFNHLVGCRYSYGTFTGTSRLAKYLTTVGRLLEPSDLAFVLPERTDPIQQRDPAKLKIHLGHGALEALREIDDLDEACFLDHACPASLLLKVCFGHGFQGGPSRHTTENFLVKEILECQRRIHDPTFLSNGLELMAFDPILKVEAVRTETAQHYSSSATEMGYTFRYPTEFSVKIDGTMAKMKLKANSANPYKTSRRGSDALATSHIAHWAGCYALQGLRVPGEQRWDLPDHTIGEEANPEAAEILRSRLKEYYSAVRRSLFDDESGISPSILSAHCKPASAWCYPNSEGHFRNREGQVVHTWIRPMSSLEYDKYLRTGKD